MKANHKPSIISHQPSSPIPHPMHPPSLKVHHTRRTIRIKNSEMTCSSRNTIIEVSIDPCRSKPRLENSNGEGGVAAGGNERANQTVICNQLKANKPGADWTGRRVRARRENRDNNSRSLTAVWGLFLWERVALLTIPSRDRGLTPV